ncbi:hypothetical protein HGRIS_007786 [Hohenbuehelia grisea]|uniref:Uncharacterized protein n=1 Tax=Hohenbuehelia grisea TaxID=104357 RepID=A0ABR3J5X4_9AGAR
MTTIPRPTGPASRRPPSRTSPSPTPASPINRGTTARAAASPRPAASTSPLSRRTSAKPAPATNGTAVNGEIKESLEAALKKETDQKEQLMVQIQDKEQVISSLSSENENLTSALHAAETRLNELYSDQSRSEMELAQRIDIAEKLRSQVRELEKEKRDLQRRYNEQISTFEAERQAFYDNEQHLKSRIQSLTQARKNSEPVLSPSESTQSAAESLAETEPDVEPSANDDKNKAEPRQDFDDPASEPAEMTALKLELSTLATSHSSLQSTLVLLQSQLVDLKRVNQEVQEENESYMILLREKTLSGQFDVMRQVGTNSSSESDVDDDEDDIDSMRSIGRTTLDRVEEEEDEFDLEESLASRDRGEDPTPHTPVSTGKPRRRGTHSPTHRGESLADLPITGPGLDLAAELGRAENKDILDGTHVGEREQPLGKGKRKKGSDGRKISASDSTGLEPSASSQDVDALRSEVKSLKDANKALSLYASKIIDRIIAQEGFEHVLAVDYDPETPSTAVPHSQPPKSPTAKPSKPRPQSVIVSRSTSSDSRTLVETPRADAAPAWAPAKLNPSPPPATSTAKAQRRSLSFDWKSFSIFNNDKKQENPALRPLTLKPGAAAVTASARKLETQEDEEDRKERERLNATMKLMGIQPSSSPVIPSSPVPAPAVAPPTTAAANPNRRFSFWGRSNSTTTDNTDASSAHSTPSIGGSSTSRLGLTAEALEQAEAENSLAALDAHERQLSSEIARGGSSGFTEPVRRSKARSRRSAGGSGSGSIVWSAGGEEGDDA